MNLLLPMIDCKIILVNSILIIKYRIEITTKNTVLQSDISYYEDCKKQNYSGFINLGVLNTESSGIYKFQVFDYFKDL